MYDSPTYPASGMSVPSDVQYQGYLDGQLQALPSFLPRSGIVSALPLSTCLVPYRPMPNHALYQRSLYPQIQSWTSIPSMLATAASLPFPTTLVSCKFLPNTAN